MIKQVLAGRTLSISLDANNMGNYRSGVFAECSANYNVNHAMNIVGVNVPGGYWILRNSWGEWWGDNGYMKLAMVCETQKQISPEYAVSSATTNNFSSIILGVQHVRNR